MSGRILIPDAGSQFAYDPVEPTIDERSICHTAFVRAYAEPDSVSKRLGRRSKRNVTTWENGRFLVLDTETVGHILTFGALECWENGKLLERVVFYNDDPYKGLHKKDVQKLADVCNELGIGPPLPAAEIFHRYIWPFRKRGGNVVGFNVPYDLSRLASYTAKACPSGKRGSRFLNGFVHVRRFKDRNKEIVDREYWRSKRDDRYKWRHYMRRALVIELQSLYKALTDRGDSLEGACKTFEVDFGDRPGEHTGIITRGNVAGCLHDVAKTRELCQALLTEYNRHPIDLSIHRAQSPAAMAKAYLAAMGILPRLEHQPDFPKDLLGCAASAYFGGRVETLISHTPVPSVYVDALSMYPTVVCLSGLWEWDIADRLEIKELDPQEVQGFVESVRENPHLLEDPSNWPKFAFFAEVESYGAHLPTRALLPKPERAGDPIPDCKTINFGPTWWHDEPLPWYTGYDLAAAYLKKDGYVRIKRAWTLVPIGQMPSLKPVMFRGEYPVDPTRDNLYKRLIELRKEKTGDPLDDERRNTGLKCVANSAAYGIMGETNPVDVDPDIENRKPQSVDVWSLENFTTDVDRPETHGRYCFFPRFALVTGAARLLLAFGQRLVEDEGGHIAYCDTDSLMIVANESGGFVQCEGGEHRDSYGRQCIRALSYEQVDRILKRLEPLNPYDRTVVPGSVFKKEFVVLNASGRPKQRWFYGDRDKTYALYTLDERGQPEIVKASAHGMGIYHSPIRGDRPQKNGLPGWLEEFWLRLLHQVHNLPYRIPAWFDLPATRRLSISTANVYKHYSKTCQPYDFLAVAEFVDGCDTDCCDNPIPATKWFDDPEDWKSCEWRCLRCGRLLELTTERGRRGAIMTYERVWTERLFRAFERKRLTASRTEPAPNSKPIGLTIPRPVVVKEVRYCGKEIVVDVSEAPPDEGLTPEELNATVALEYKKPAVHEARQLLAGGVNVADAARISGIHRTTIRRIQTGQKPREKTARELVRAGLLRRPVDYDQLRDLVREHGVEWIARLSGLNPRTVYRFLAGQKPHTESVDKLVDAIIISPVAWALRGL